MHVMGPYLLIQYDLKKVPENLRPIAFLIGKWRSEFGGKAFFPTIPKFTYGEEIVFRLCNPQMTALAALNYTAFAWDNNDMNELHSEYGYITVENGTRNVSMNTIMSNG
uniref:THAP4-like heme-binding beta-barrel domain-containing protein n=1 Tax=Parascaris equorum TaxID=6256 RepID=A0A914RNI4_PAREQ